MIAWTHRTVAVSPNQKNLGRRHPVEEVQGVVAGSGPSACTHVGLDRHLETLCTTEQAATDRTTMAMAVVWIIIAMTVSSGHKHEKHGNNRDCCEAKHQHSSSIGCVGYYKLASVFSRVCKVQRLSECATEMSIGNSRTAIINTKPKMKSIRLITTAVETDTGRHAKHPLFSSQSIGCDHSIKSSNVSMWRQSQPYTGTVCTSKTATLSINCQVTAMVITTSQPALPSFETAISAHHWS